MRSGAVNFLCAHSLLVCSLLSLLSCGGGSATQPVAGAQQADPLKILTTQPAEGVVGQNYSFQIEMSGGGPPFTWSLVLGSLPPGVSLNANTGVLAGTPTQEGNYSFTVKVADSTFSGQQASMQSLSITVSPPALSITTPSLPGGIVGQPYNFQLQATGGISPYTWSILTGSLAPGVELNELTGEISGTPTQAGTTPVTIQVMDSSSPQNLARLILGGAESQPSASSSN